MNRKNWIEIEPCKFVKEGIDTNYPMVSFNVNGNNLDFNLSKCGPGNYYLQNDGLYNYEGKLVSWWQFKFSLKNLDITNDNLKLLLEFMNSKRP